MSIAVALITAEEFAEMPDDGRDLELVEGRVIESPPPRRLPGRICYRVTMILGRNVDANDLGTVYSNDTGIITIRDPDSVRGADVASISYDRRVTAGGSFTLRLGSTLILTCGSSASSTRKPDPPTYTLPISRRGPSAPTMS